MYKKVVAVLLAGSMVMTSAVAVMAGETEAEAVATVGDDAEVKEALEEKVGDVTDEDGSFDESKLVELMASLFGPEDGEELPEIGKEKGLLPLSRSMKRSISILRKNLPTLWKKAMKPSALIRLQMWLYLMRMELSVCSGTSHSRIMTWTRTARMTLS